MTHPGCQPRVSGLQTCPIHTASPACTTGAGAWGSWGLGAHTGPMHQGESWVPGQDALCWDAEGAGCWPSGVRGTRAGRGLLPLTWHATALWAKRESRRSRVSWGRWGPGTGWGQMGRQVSPAQHSASAAGVWKGPSASALHPSRNTSAHPRPALDSNPKCPGQPLPESPSHARAPAKLSAFKPLFLHSVP